MLRFLDELELSDNKMSAKMYFKSWNFEYAVDCSFVTVV